MGVYFIEKEWENANFNCIDVDGHFYDVWESTGLTLAKCKEDCVATPSCTCVDY